MAGPKPTITVIGSLNMDLVTYTPRVPDAGETLKASSFQMGSGGKGANQAVACARLSRARSGDNAVADIKMVGAVGKDTNGAKLIADLLEDGVDVSGVEEVEGLNTGVAVITVEEESGENRIMICAGANDTVHAGRFEELAAPLPDLIIMQLEIPLPTVSQILETAHVHKVPVLLNPAPAPHKGAIPDRCFPMITHLILNETEASLMTGSKAIETETESGSRTVATMLQSLGAANVVITLGAKGVFYQSHDGESGLVPALPAKVVDTTAAGDTFVGMYALCVASDKSVSQAVRAANKAAAKTVEKKGAQSSIPFLDELDESAFKT